MARKRDVDLSRVDVNDYDTSDFIDKRERETEQNDEDADGSLLDRRSYIKMAGAAAAALTAGSNVASAAAEDPTVSLSDGDDVAGVLEGISDGETVVLPRGTYRLDRDVSISADDFTFHGNGATIETHGRLDVRINGVGWDFGYLNVKPQNQSNPDAWCRFRPDGDQWHLHHVAWTSRNDTRYFSGDDRRMSHMLPGVDAGGSAEITDCWFGHGCHLDHGKSALKMWGVLDGEVWLRRCFFKQSGVYGANSSQDYVRNEGVTHFEDCYFENCYNGCARTGSHYDPAYVRGCVMNATDPSKTPTREGHGSSGPYNRGVWAFHGPVHIEETHISSFDRAIDVSLNHDIRRTPSIEFHSGAYDGRVKNAEHVAMDSSVGTNPSTSPPDTCVTSPEEAYLGADDGSQTGSEGSGDSVDESANPHERTLTIQGQGQAANYSVSVSEALSGINSSIEQWDSVSESSATGWVTEPTHTDVFGFDGEITEFGFESGTARVFVDGEEIDPATLGSDSGSPDGRTLTIQGQGEAANYAFEVSDALEPATDDTLEVWDTVSETSATGWVTDSIHEDRYVFTGDVTEFGFESGTARVFVDGEEVEPANLGDDSPVEHTLTIRGQGNAANYAFEVSDALEPATDDTLEVWDTVSETSATGWVTDSTHEDRYVFTGDVTGFKFVHGEADVLLDGESVSPESLVQ